MFLRSTGLMPGLAIALQLPFRPVEATLPAFEGDFPLSASINWLGGTFAFIAMLRVQSNDSVLLWENCCYNDTRLNTYKICDRKKERMGCEINMSWCDINSLAGGCAEPSMTEKFVWTRSGSAMVIKKSDKTIFRYWDICEWKKKL